MSISLLQDPTHLHDIEDDRESALYVLLWTALGFTKHSDSKGSSGSTAADLKRAFVDARSEEFRGVMRSGALESLFLLGKSRLCFDGRPPLDALVDELCQEFGVLYKREPSRYLSAERLAFLVAWKEYQD
jgi:hypothetical protein